MSPKLSFTLRSATAADAALLTQLIRELAVFERLESEVTGDAAAVAESLGQKHCSALLAFVGEEPAGFALYFFNYSTFLARRGLYLEDLFVRPAFRRHGLGRLLLHRLAQIAVAEKCGRFEWAVLDWNEDAIRFYRSIGAAPMEDWIVQRVTGDALRRLAEA